MKITKKLAKQLGELTTRNEAGQHFYESFNLPWSKLENAGIIRIYRPEHDGTGIAYSQEYHTVEVNPQVSDWFDSYGNLYEDDFPSNWEMEWDDE